MNIVKKTIALVVMGMVCVFAALGQAEEGTEEESIETTTVQQEDNGRPAKYVISATYFGTLGGYENTDMFDSDYMSLTDYNNQFFQFKMGLNVYKNISAFIDFNITDVTFKRVMDIAGLIGTQYFDIAMDYRYITGNFSFNSPVETIGEEDYDENFRTVALMFKPPIDKDGILYPFLNLLKFGFIWNSSTYLTVVDDYLDPATVLNAWGLRVHLQRDVFNIGLGLKDGKLKPGNNFGFMYDFIVDLAWGTPEPSQKVIDKLGYTPDLELAMYVQMRFMAGLQYVRMFSKNKYFDLAGGLEINSFGIGSAANSTEQEHYYGLTAVGLFVRAGFAF